MLFCFTCLYSFFIISFYAINFNVDQPISDLGLFVLQPGNSPKAMRRFVTSDAPSLRVLESFNSIPFLSEVSSCLNIESLDRRANSPGYRFSFSSYERELFILSNWLAKMIELTRKFQVLKLRFLIVCLWNLIICVQTQPQLFENV